MARVIDGQVGVVAGKRRNDIGTGHNNFRFHKAVVRITISGVWCNDIIRWVDCPLVGDSAHGDHEGIIGRWVDDAGVCVVAVVAAGNHHHNAVEPKQLYCRAQWAVVIGLGHCAVERHIDDTDVVLAFVLEDPLQTGHNTRRSAYALVVGHSDIDEVGIRGSADEDPVGAASIAGCRPCNMGAVAVEIVNRTAARKVDMGENTALARFVRQVCVFGNATVDDGNRDVSTLLLYCFVPNFAGAYHLWVNVYQPRGVDTVGA